MDHDPEAIARARLILAIADTVEAHPAVARLDGGMFDAVTSYLPGRRVEGIRLDETTLELSVVLRLGEPLPQVVNDLRRQVAPLVPGVAVDVVVSDVVVEEEADGEPADV